MKSFKETTFSNFIEIDKESILFQNGSLSWLYWNPNLGAWEWSHSDIIETYIPKSSMDKLNIYYFVYSASLKILTFVVVFNIRTGLWVKPINFPVFQALIKCEYFEDKKEIFPGETIDIFTYDTRCPTYKRVFRPEDNGGFLNKLWRLFSKSS